MTETAKLHANTTPPLPAGPGHAWVIGGGSGIGLAVAGQLAQAGWRLSLSGRRAQPLSQACEALSAGWGVAALAWPVDAADAQALQHTAAQVAQAQGGVDLLVYAAGDAVSGRFDRQAPLQWRETLDTHVLGAMAAAQAVWPGMRDRGQGAVVLVGSTASEQGFAYVAPYVAAKHAQLGLVRAWQEEWRGSGVRALCLCPSFTDTPLLARAVDRLARQAGIPHEHARERLWAQMPGGRPLQPREVAQALMGWLAQPPAEPAPPMLAVWPGDDPLSGGLEAAAQSA